jgi:hypothetical protein
MLMNLLHYKNRQIIINEYVDEELTNRNGFFIDEINLKGNDLLFIKNGQLLYQIDLPINFVLRKDGSFPNFYVIELGPVRTEIYFP